MRRAIAVVALLGALVPVGPAVAASHSHFYIMASAEGTKAKFKYLTALDDAGLDVGWVAGDRVAYRCAYMFLRSGDRLIGRATFTRIEYANVNDKYMDEAERFYDGTIYNGSQHQLNDCPGPDEPYQDTTGPIGPTPVVTFSLTATGQTLEVRDFSTIEQKGGAPFRFQVVGQGPDRVRIVAYNDESEPVLAIYYDRLWQGITLTVGT